MKKQCKEAILLASMVCSMRIRRGFMARICDIYGTDFVASCLIEMGLEKEVW